MQLHEEILLTILQEGNTSIPNILLTNYHKLGLSDQEMMLLTHILHSQAKGNFFPSVNELEQRMSANTEDIMRMLQRLVRNGLITIDENKDIQTNIIYEAYNLKPIYQKLMQVFDMRFKEKQKKEVVEQETKTISNIYNTFEKELGRPLSPMEIESITTWVDQDKYPDHMILYALKEAVFANKLNLRYVDKILFEWQSKNIKTVDQIKQHVKSFRMGSDNKKDVKNTKDSKGKTIQGFEFYNWLNEENEE